MPHIGPIWLPDWLLVSLHIHLPDTRIQDPLGEWFLVSEVEVINYKYSDYCNYVVFWGTFIVKPVLLLVIKYSLIHVIY